MQAQKNKIFGFCTVIALAIMFIASAIFIPVKSENVKAETIMLVNNSTTIETSYGVDDLENAELQSCLNYIRSHYSSNIKRPTFNSRFTKEEQLRQKKYNYHNQTIENYLYDNEKLLKNCNYFFTYTNEYANSFIQNNGVITDLTTVFDIETQTFTFNGSLDGGIGSFAWFELGSMYDWLPSDYFGSLNLSIEKISGSFIKGTHATMPEYGGCFTLGLTDVNNFTNQTSGNNFFAYSYFTSTGGSGVYKTFSNYHELADIGNQPILFMFAQGGCIFDNYKFKISLSNSIDYNSSATFNLIENIVSLDETSYNAGYVEGKADGQNLADDFNLTSIFWEIIDAPFRLIGQALNFDFLGINFADTIKVILTLLIVVGVIKIFL